MSKDLTSFDNMPMNDLIELYYEKHHALHTGNMEKLIELKKKCPELFDPKKDAEVADIIQYAKEFQASERYKELLQLELREKLTVIENDLFKK